MIQLSNDEIIKLYKLASVGKLVGGLVHNLNGPLQNLGLDIEIAIYSLKNESNLKNDTAESIITRFKRMEEEHEKLNLLIKTASAKTGEYTENDFCLNIYEYIRQEILFLHTNLYFKHNVETEIMTGDEPIPIQNLSHDSLTALGWFMQTLVEELESQKLKGLTIKLLNRGSSLTVLFQTRGGKLSEKFLTQLQEAKDASPSYKPENRDLGILIMMTIFQANGITMEFDTDASNSSITIIFSLSEGSNC
jgi:hypothetical protein